MSLDSTDSDLTHNIILVGFMGCGKSTIAREISQRLGYPLVDTDDLIVSQEGREVREIFESDGQEHFRDLETSLLKSLTTRHDKSKIISTGGGLPLREQNREMLKELGYVVWLQAGVETIFERTSRTNKRPLLQTEDPRETINTMLTERNHIYADASHLTIQTDDLSINEVAHGIIESACYYFSKI